MEQGLITLDTSGPFTLLNRAGIAHEPVGTALFEDRGPYLVPAGVLAQIACVIEERLRSARKLATGHRIRRVHSGPQRRGFRLHRELVSRYDDLPLGFADASMISCAERNGGRVLTLDRRHFGVVAAEGHISLLP